MFDKEKRLKQDNLVAFMCSGDYQDSFFKPFSSFSDAKKNVKAVVALPIINLVSALHTVLNALTCTTLGLMNIVIGAVTFDLNELMRGGDNLKAGARNLASALYYTISIITDTLVTLTRLITHSLATVVSGVCKAAEAISECCTPSSAF